MPHFVSPDATLLRRIEHIYTGLEEITRNEASNLTDSGKAKLRMLQAELQRVRLLILDSEKPQVDT